MTQQYKHTFNDYIGALKAHDICKSATIMTNLNSIEQDSEGAKALKEIFKKCENQTSFNAVVYAATVDFDLLKRLSSSKSKELEKDQTACGRIKILNQNYSARNIKNDSFFKTILSRNQKLEEAKKAFKTLRDLKDEEKNPEGFSKKLLGDNYVEGSRADKSARKLFDSLKKQKDLDDQNLISLSNNKVCVNKKEVGEFEQYIANKDRHEVKKSIGCCG